MSISTIIEFLQKLKEEKGDIQVGADFRLWDIELHHNEELGTVFGE